MSLHCAPWNWEVDHPHWRDILRSDVIPECKPGDFVGNLHKAIREKNAPRVKILLGNRNGADVNKPFGNKTALYVAVDVRFVEIIPDLFEHGAKTSVASKNIYSYSPHPFASGYVKCSSALPVSETPLHLAVKREDREILKMLLTQAGDYCDCLYALDDQYASVLARAFEMGNDEVTKLIINHGGTLLNGQFDVLLLDFLHISASEGAGHVRSRSLANSEWFLRFLKKIFCGPSELMYTQMMRHILHTSYLNGPAIVLANVQRFFVIVLNAGAFDPECKVALWKDFKKAQVSEQQGQQNCEFLEIFKSQFTNVQSLKGLSRISVRKGMSTPNRNESRCFQERIQSLDLYEELKLYLMDLDII